MDYGFNAKTLSFHVVGTLMIEPTESKDQAELDRFCTAVIAIKSEIDAVAVGIWAKHAKPLKMAPHTAAEVSADVWPHP